jgi:hypothetical protein
MMEEEKKTEMLSMYTNKKHVPKVMRVPVLLSTSCKPRVRKRN